MRTVFTLRGGLSASAISLLLASALAGCAMQGPDLGVLALNDGAVMAKAGQPSLRSGLGVKDQGDVAVDSSMKAPKGALADRDYTGARLDAERALQLINEYRTGKGLKALKLDARLSAAAKAHSQDLASGDRISHYGSDGSSPWDRVKRSGYGAKVAAENVGTGQASLEEVFKGWTESPGHNRNLLLPAARDMGIALVAAPKSEFKTFWTLIVASSGS